MDNRPLTSPATLYQANRDGFHASPFGAAIKRLLDGCRFCVGCGQVDIEPGSPAWIIRCKRCYDAQEPAFYCRYCGDDMGKNARLFA